MKINYIDIHSHLNFPQFDEDREEVIGEMREKGIATICVGTDEETSRQSVALADKHEHIYATVGIHPVDDFEAPHEAYSTDISWMDDILKQENIVAIGECGLDYYRDSSKKEEQKHVFIQQVEYAVEKKLPLMIHGRPSAGSMDAYEDILDILTAYSHELADAVGGNVHFFVGDISIAKRFLELGFTLSFDGPITFSREYDEVIAYIPLESIMAETDAPFAAPEPFRGRRNSPLYVPYIVKALARIKGIEEEEVRKQSVANAVRVFGLT